MIDSSGLKSRLVIRYAIEAKREKEAGRMIMYFFRPKRAWKNIMTNAE